MTINQKIDYLFSKINWKDSHLDAKAIEIMNNLKSDIKRDFAVIENESTSINKSDLQELRDTLALCSLIDKSGQAKEQVDKMDSLFPFLNGG